MGLQQMIQTVAMTGTTRQQKLAILSDGKLYISTDLANPVLIAASVIPILGTAQLCQISGPASVFIVTAGQPIKKVDAAAGTVASLTSTSGTVPTDCTICCIYRDRLIVSGKSAEPQNFFASASGNVQDWDYADRDAAAAFAGNNTPGGLLGDIITALIPASVDTLIFGCDHSIYRMVGDIAAGGRIDFISDRVGVIGPNAWCRDNAGSVYFASRSGLFITSTGGELKNLSLGRYTNFFAGLDRRIISVQLVWDQKRFGVWIFAANKDGSDSVHCFYDARTDGFFEQQFPANVGPACSIAHEGANPADTHILLGGADGYVRRIDDLAVNDDGAAIASYVYLSPQRPAGDSRMASLIALDTTLGEQPPGTTGWNCTARVQVAPDLNRAVNTPTASRTTTWTAPGKQKSFGLRIGEHAIVLRLGNDVLNTTWTAERITGRMQFAGRTR